MQDLCGACKKNIENGLCLGCNKLENPNFTGQAKCDLAVDPRNKIKEILGIQEKIKDENISNRPTGI